MDERCFLHCISKPACKDTGPWWGSVPGEGFQGSSSHRHQPSDSQSSASLGRDRNFLLSKCSRIPIASFMLCFLPHKAFALLSLCNFEDEIQEWETREGGSGVNSWHSRAWTKPACGQVSFPFIDQCGPDISVLLPEVFASLKLDIFWSCSYVLHKKIASAVWSVMQTIPAPHVLGHHLATIRLRSSIFCWLQHWA